MKYRLKNGFELKDIAGELLLLPRGADTVDYNYVTVFNEAGALLYRAMADFTDTDTLAQMLVEKYSTGTIVLSGLIRIAFSTVPREKLAALFANVAAAVRDLKGQKI